MEGREWREKTVCERKGKVKGSEARVGDNQGKQHGGATVLKN